jgi:hypothetical protein
MTGQVSDAARGAGAPERLEIAVRTDSQRVAAFEASIRGGAGAGEEPAPGEAAVPLTYPFCWITLPEVRPMLRRMIGGADVLPVHESQSFDYRRPLAIDAEYRVAFAFERRADPARLVVSAAVSTPRGEPCATFETVLRLVTHAAHAAAGASPP